jgi:hypothetical protein
MNTHHKTTTPRPLLAGWAVALLGVALASSALAQDTITNAMSPVVSYQYNDSLADMGTNSPVVSAIVSYQYFDWPDAAELQFQNSVSVSFFYQATNAQFAALSISVGIPSLTLLGVPGQTYGIQASTNLIDWVPLANVAIPAVFGPAQFSDSEAANYPRRFYRAVAP